MKFMLKRVLMDSNLQYYLVITDEKGKEYEHAIKENTIAWYIARLKDHDLYEKVLLNTLDYAKTCDIPIQTQLNKETFSQDTMYWVTDCFNWAASKRRFESAYGSGWEVLQRLAWNDWMYDTLEEAFEDTKRQVLAQPPMPLEEQVNILDRITSIVDNI